MSRHWRPMGTRIQFRDPEIGALVAHDHEVYRVREITPVPRTDWNEDDQRAARSYGPKGAPRVVVLRPARITGDDPKLRRHDRHILIRGFADWEVYPTEYYPVCAHCGEPPPCREQVAADTAASELRDMARYETPGICPACGEPITARQKFRTFNENVIVPLGPPVTFHTRGRCSDGLWNYEDLWRAADPENRESTRPPKCGGRVRIHVGAGTYECTEGVNCPGLNWGNHVSMTACGCPEHPGGFTGADTRNARNLATEGGDSA